MRAIAWRSAGQATVEFALAAPIVILLLLGTLDFGRALMAYVTVNSASREGLRYAARNPGATADIAGAVAARSAPLDTSRLTVTAEYSNDSGATWVPWTSGGAGAISGHVTVARLTVSYPWSAVTSAVGAFFIAGSGSAVFTAQATGIAEATRQ